MGVCLVGPDGVVDDDDTVPLATVREATWGHMASALGLVGRRGTVAPEDVERGLWALTAADRCMADAIERVMAVARFCAGRGIRVAWA